MFSVCLVNKFGSLWEKDVLFTVHSLFMYMIIFALNMLMDMALKNRLPYKIDRLPYKNI